MTRKTAVAPARTIAPLTAVVKVFGAFAASDATDESLVTIASQKLKVIEGARPGSGRTLAAKHGGTVRVCTAADGEGFEEMFLNTLNGRVP